MGAQLWTSPVTGYRRRGTRLVELRALLGDGITARAVLEPLRSCPADAHADEMASVLRRRDYDFAGVQAAEEGPVLGFVQRARLTSGLVKDHVEPLTADALISDGTHLAELLATMATRTHVFVLVGSQVKAIATRADLNKPPVRVYLFGLVSLLEMHLGFWVQAGYPDEAWQVALKGKRLDAAKALMAERKKRNEHVSLLACLQFCDKRDLIAGREDLRTKLGFSSKKQAGRLLERTEDLRNRLAHSQEDLVQGSSWPDLIQDVQSLEDAVHNSDKAVEEEAARSAQAGGDGLWTLV